MRHKVALATAMFLVSGFDAGGAPREDRLGVVKQLVSRVGQVLGAANTCKDIAPERVKALTDKIMSVAIASAASKEEFAILVQTFDASETDGRRELSGGKTTCKLTERDIVELERAANQTGESPAAPVASAAQVQTQAASPAPTSTQSGLRTAPRGVTDQEIRFGISAPFSGSAKELGQNMKLGIQAAFGQANEAGGINGRMLRLITADDGYEPTRTAETMTQLYDKEQVFGIVGNVGTPTAVVAVPYALERRMLFFGAFSGASVLRRDPPDRYVFNYRASYTEETEAVVRYLVKVKRLKPEQIAVFAQQDSFGDSGFAGVAKAMRTLRGGDDKPIVRFGFKRNTLDVEEAVAQLKKQPAPAIKAIVMVAPYRAAAKFIEKTRDSFPGMIYTNVSFVGSTALAMELTMLGPKYVSGVIVTQVVPAVSGYSSLILEYKTALQKYFPGEAVDYVSLEGYVMASVLIEALKRAGPQLDTERVIDALENMRDFDLGLGTPITFGKGEHQGSHKVWGTMLTEAGKYEPLDLQ